VIVAFARVGSRLFWNVLPTSAGDDAIPAVPTSAWLAPAALLTCLVALVGFGGPVLDLAAATARQLATPAGYVDAVLGPAAAREEPRRRLP
jgi:hypothetical protein